MKGFLEWLAVQTPGAMNSEQAVYTAREILLTGEYNPDGYTAIMLMKFEEEMAKRDGGA